MPAPTSGLARVTIRAPRRRLDLAIPHQVPLAELLPEVLRRAGEGTGDGWLLRRGDGASLIGETALAHQGVRDGDVLYLVPRQLAWPEPAYDDVVEEIAEGARQHGRSWDAAATRGFALAAAGLVLLTGLAGLVALPQLLGGVAAAGIAVTLLLVGALASRAMGDGTVGAAAAGFALPYAAASGALVEPDAPSRVLVGGCALVLASVLGAVAAGRGLRIFVGGGVAGLGTAIGGLIAYGTGPAGAAAIVVVVAVGAIGLAPALAVRLGRLPFPAVSAAPEILAAEPRPRRPEVRAAVARSDELLVGALLGIGAVSGGCVAVLAGAGVAGPLLAGLASVALLLRARLFPNLAARLPLLISGLLGLAVTVGAVTQRSPAAAAVLAGAAFAAVAVLLTTAATANRARDSVYLARIADILDVAAVVALVPVACGVLDLYVWVSGLAG